MALEILKRLGRNKAAEELKKTYTEKEVVPRPLVSSSPALDLPTGWKSSAGGAHGPIAPMFRNATNCRVMYCHMTAEELRNTYIDGTAGSRLFVTAAFASDLQTDCKISAGGASGAIAPEFTNVFNCRVIYCNKAAEELRKTYIEGTTASHPFGISSSGLELPTGWKISAVGATDAFAPVFRNATNCTVIYCNVAAEVLKKTYKEGAAASHPLATSRFASDLPTGWKTSAGGAPAAIAPVFKNATNCTVIYCNVAAAEFKKTYKDGAATSHPLGISSSTLDLPNECKISAGGAIGAIAPVFRNATNCSVIVNVTVN